MTTPDTIPPATDPGTAPASREDLDAQIAKLTAERDGLTPADPTPAAAAVADAPAATGLKVGQAVHYSTHDTLSGSSLSGMALVARVVEPYEQPDGSMTDPQYVVAPLVEFGRLLNADELTAADA